jgi:hypothetical protein
MKFLYACELSHVLTRSINSPLLLRRQVVVARSESRAVRRVVKQSPVEMLQQCSSTSSCMRTRIVMERHYIGYQHSTPFVLNNPTQFFFLSVSHYTCDIIAVSRCMISTVNTPLLSQLPSASRQADNICLNFFGLFG